MHNRDREGPSASVGGGESQRRVVMDGLDKKSTAPSHTRKVICPHCKTEVNYRNLTRHIEIKHKQISDTKTFHVRDPQSNKVLKPTKLTSFYGVKRKDGDLENDSPRPCKKRNASGDSAVSLDFTSGDDDGDDDGDEDEEEVFKNLESEEDIRKKPTSGEEPEPVSGEDCVIEVAGGAEPHEEKEGEQESLAKESCCRQGRRPRRARQRTRCIQPS